MKYQASSKHVFSHRYTFQDYSIEHLSHYDDIDIVKPWHRWLILVQPLVIAVVFITYSAYFGYRIWCNYQYRLFKGGLAEASWIFICMEGICLVPYFFWMVVLLISLGDRKRPKLRLRGDAVPTVDVLFTACGEVVPMMMNTIRAACNIDYPRDRYRIIVCDDAADPVFRDAVQVLTAEYPHLYYQARTKAAGMPHHFKAGNLQSGIDYAVDLPGGPAEFLATLDADMIPDPEWLRALLPHLLRDPELALISPPQTFWNVPADDPLCQSICEFIHYLELRKDHIGAAWCTGSGVVFKRHVIDALGGWPTPSMAEDQLLSSMMNGEGYKTAYLHEFMQVGMIPESIISHLKQRTRWAVGTMQTARVLNWGFPGKYTRHMTFPQRLCIFTFAFNTIMTIPVFIAFWIIPALLYWGRDLMVYTTAEQLRWQLRLCAIWAVSLRINEVVLTLPSGYIQGQRSAMAWQFMMPYLALSILRCYLLPKWLGGKEIAFLATGAVRGRLNERSASLRAGLWVRIKLMTVHCRIWFFVLFVLYCLGGAGTDWWRAWRVGQQTGDVRDSLRHLLVNSMLPPTWWLFLVTAYLMPVGYMLFPPTVPDRDEMMDFDPKTGVGQPKCKEIKQVWGVLPLIREILWGLTIIYCIVLFVGTFLY
ncbi:nucleotide-diphospho-sugar transferase [Microdochium trichocladiopsis]|uniref:Nucleotide-diphospho-sugar transferase n=1 Tax=Microdochium trichocladiopsis TaxID=1682393 RepID=A0A9P8Y026_9PEZI|nr:nucleotide-diphospho-sugar transferase [Microdochium trichocladiopsis]KAH7024381.1 nucleotide-diphospho-sugar transferase [Microdochium trichocladiopsis]